MPLPLRLRAPSGGWGGGFLISGDDFPRPRMQQAAPYAYYNELQEALSLTRARGPRLRRRFRRRHRRRHLRRRCRRPDHQASRLLSCRSTSTQGTLAVAAAR